MASGENGVGTPAAPPRLVAIPPSERLLRNDTGDPMSLIVPIDTAPSFEPKPATPAPDRLISGSPAFLTWAQDDTGDGHVRTGVWEATPGVTRSIKGTTFEFCHILSGVVELSEDGGETWTFRAGDSFVMKPGFVGIWKTIETVRKIYVVVG